MFNIETLALASVLGVLAVAILYPESFINDPSRIFGIAIIPLNWLAPAVFLSAVICVFFRRSVIRLTLVDAALLGFFTYLLIRNIAAGGDTMAVVKYTVFGVSLFYLAQIACHRDNMRMLFLWFIVIIVLVVGCYGLVEFAFQHNIIFRDAVAKIIPEPGAGVHRIGSTVAHPVALGAFLVQVLPFTILLWVKTSSKKTMSIGAAATAIAALTLLLTFSKGSWIAAGLLILGAIIVFAFRKEVGVIRYIVAGVGVVALAVIVFWNKIIHELSWRMGGSVGHRERAWRGAIDAIREQPLTGVGFKQGSARLMEMDVGISYFQFAKRTIAVDNNYLSLFLEGGLIGFCLWLFFIEMVIWRAVKALLEPGLDRQWIAAAMVSAIGLIINAFTFEAWLIWPNYIMFMVTAGIIAVLSADSAQRYES